MKKSVPTLYLFDNIFYPRTIIPLTVDDDISKQMLLDCYKNKEDIALYSPHPRAKGIGTLGKIIQIDYTSGKKLNVIIQGLIRIKLISMDQENPYPKYFISEYCDTDERIQTLVDHRVHRLHIVLETWLGRHVHSMHERERFMKDINSPAKLIDNLCMFLIKDIELKQILLESTSLFDRVQMMNALLIGNTPETEDIEICEAIKHFERLEIDYSKSAS